MIHFSRLLVWTVLVILNHMAMSADANLESVLELDPRLEEIQSSRELFTERGNINNIFGTSTSTHPNQNDHPNSKRQRLRDGDEEVVYQQRVYRSPEPQSFDRHPTEPLKRLRDGTIMEGAYLSLGSPEERSSSIRSMEKLRDGTTLDDAYLSLDPRIDLGSSMRSMENLEGSSKGEPRMAREPLTRHRYSHLSSSQRPRYNNQNDPAGHSFPNHSGLYGKELYQTREIALQMKQVLTPNRLPIAHTAEPGSSNNIASQKGLYDAYGPSFSQGTTSIPSASQNLEAREGKIDIRNFHLHTPDKMCSAAAIHYTQDLIKTLSKKYLRSSESYIYPTWEVGKMIWTSERLLPFVYFVVSCNPSNKIWNKIRTLTVSFLRNYDKWSIDKAELLNQEKHARFLLWHTEVIYYTLLLEPMVESSSVSLTIPGLSTLARTFLLIQDDVAFQRFVTTANSRAMIERHISETFENDYIAGYPTAQHHHNVEVSTLRNWNQKSNEIMNMAKGIVWPRRPTFGWDRSEPVLLMNGNTEHDTLLKGDTMLSQFITYWEKDLEKTIQFVSTSQLQPKNLALPQFPLVRICKGLNRFVNGKVKNQKQNVNVDNKPIEYSVTFFTRFLHQDLDDKNFKIFWNYFDTLWSA